MDTGSADDLALARRAASGDPRAQEALYARCADPLFAFIAHHFDGATPEVEELWQDTLLAAFQSLSAYRGESRFFTWLCCIARRRIADRLRRRRGAPAAFSNVPPGQLAALMDAGPLPEEILAQRDTRIRVVEALAALPDDYRAALVARYADQQGVDEVAELLGRTYKATESLLTRARVAFRAALAVVEERVEETDDGR